MDWIVKKGLELQDDLKKLQTSPSDRSDTNNPQTMWKTFKAETTQWVAHEAKKKHYKQRSRVQKLRKDREEILTNPDFEENGTLQWNELVLAKEIEHLEKVMSWNNHERLKAKIAWHRERLDSTWPNLSKSRKPRDPILRLRTVDSPTHYETCSDKMAELAKNYHNTLQNKDLDELTIESLDQKIEEVLETIPEEQKFQSLGLAELNKGVTKEAVEEALKQAKKQISNQARWMPLWTMERTQGEKYWGRKRRKSWLRHN